MSKHNSGESQSQERKARLPTLSTGFQLCAELPFPGWAAFILLKYGYSALTALLIGLVVGTQPCPCS